MKKVKYKIGDRVRIISDVSEHEFRIGRIVTLSGIGEDLGAKDTLGKVWFFTEQEIERVCDVDENTTGVLRLRNIDDAILLLKDNGYKVKKKVCKWVKC